MSDKQRGVRRVRQRKAAALLAKGVPATQALIQAGYSKSYAYARQYRVIEQPEIRSLVTAAFRRAGLTMKQVIQPYLDGLQATIITREGLRARKTKIPDLGLRMDAADRILRLMGQVPRPVDYPDPPAPPCEIHIHAESDRPAPGPQPAQPEPRANKAADGPTVQQAVLINVHPERDRPR
jgi:hypothetical protein